MYPNSWREKTLPVGTSSEGLVVPNSHGRLGHSGSFDNKSAGESLVSMRNRSVRSSEKSEQKKQLKRQELTETVHKFTERYQQKKATFREQNAKNAESVLALCQVAHDAKVALGKHKEFLTQFRADNGLTNKSTFSQFCTIGKHYGRLSPHAAVLPSSWYAMYRIARLDDTTFANAVKDNKFHPLISQREVKELGDKTTKPRKDFHIKIEIAADDEFNVDRAVAFQNALIAFLREQQGKWSCVDPDIRRSKALDAALAESSSLKKAA